MKPKLIAIYLLIVLLPLGLLAWLGSELARDERQRVKMRFLDLLDARLEDRNGTMARTISDREREFQSLCELSPDAGVAELRRISRKQRFVRQMFVLKPNGSFQYPLLNADATERERGFFERTRSVWESGIRLGSLMDSQSFKTANQTQNPVQSQSLNMPSQASLAEAYGWHTWFWGNGVQFLFWRRAPTGHVIGLEVDRMALIADVLSELPDTDNDESAQMPGRIMLRDAQNNVLYQWGTHEPKEGDQPASRLPVVAPLSMWSLEYFAAPGLYPVGFSRSTIFNVTIGIVSGCTVLLLLAAYFFRENTREMRDAAQRVSFVNQVSHELKTPLTNIRMYAELLQTQFDAAGKPASGADENLGVIVSESQRLSRMINNVLTFAKGQRGQLSPNRRAEVPDEVVESTIEHFKPALEAKQIDVEFAGEAKDSVTLDPDYLEQILGNLLSNVEKYVPNGGHAKVQTNFNGRSLTVRVFDDGPGIPEAQREAVFEPFMRLSNKLSDGITGTGIGLSISRELARTHGGELSIEATERGASFKLELETKDEA